MNQSQFDWLVLYSVETRLGRMYVSLQLHYADLMNVLASLAVN